MLRVHVPQRLGVQPVVDQPDEVRQGRRRVRRRRPTRRRSGRCSRRRRSSSTTPAIRRRAIEKNSHAYRPLGLGYANLGALLMSRGLPYDSDGGRDYAAALTALMTGEAYAQSARIARDHGGPFSGYEKNREPFLRVMRKHRDAMRDVNGAQRAVGSLRRRQGVVGRCGGARRAVRLPQRAGDRAGADRHHRLHDGLRHHRRRAGHRAGQVQEAGRRRDDEDRQPDGADGAAPSSATRRRRSRRSSTTSTRTRRSKARRGSRTRTCRCSTARSRRPRASARFTTWATSR